MIIIIGTVVEHINPLYSGNPKMSNLANSEDPDEMPQDVAFLLGLHCLLRQKY